MPAPAAVRRRVRVEMRPEGGKTFRGTGLPCRKGADAARSEIAVESSPSKVPVGRGARWATIVSAARASAEPWSPPEGTTKPEAKAGLAVGEEKNKLGRQSTVAKEAGTRDESPQRSRKVVNPHTWPVCAKIAKTRGGGSPPRTAQSGQGTRPLKPTLGVGEGCEARRLG